ncbi:MAG: hypothetical protein GY788_11600 [bacterium]|nr:hypothetical protein [bacterium]
MFEEAQALAAQTEGDDFVISDADGLGEGGPKTKFKQNNAAIRFSEL